MNYIGRNSLLGNIKKIAKFLMRTFLLAALPSSMDHMWAGEKLKTTTCMSTPAKNFFSLFSLTSSLTERGRKRIYDRDPELYYCRLIWFLPHPPHPLVNWDSEQDPPFLSGSDPSLYSRYENIIFIMVTLARRGRGGPKSHDTIKAWFSLLSLFYDKIRF